MDKKLIHQYGEDILCYRLRSARQKKRMQYEDFYKHLIEVDKERDELYTKKKNLGWQPLNPPLQRGWERFFVLKHDVAVSKHAAFFQNILDKINTRDWSHRKDFLVKYRRQGTKKYKVKGQELLRPDERRFSKLNFSPQEKQFFHEQISIEQWSKLPVKRFVFTEPWRFVLRVRPNMIDKVKILDADIESRMGEIDNYMERNVYYTKIKLRYPSYRWRLWQDFEKYDEGNPLKNKPLHVILDLAKEEII